MLIVRVFAETDADARKLQIWNSEGKVGGFAKPSMPEAHNSCFVLCGSLSLKKPDPEPIGVNWCA